MGEIGGVEGADKVCEERERETERERERETSETV